MKISKLALLFLVILFVINLPQVFTLEAMALEDDNHKINRITTVTLEEDGNIKVVSSTYVNFDYFQEVPLLISDDHPLDYKITNVSVKVNGKDYSNFGIYTEEFKPNLHLKSIAITDNLSAPFTVEYTYYIENFKEYSGTNFVFDLYTTFPKTSFEKTYEYDLIIFSNKKGWSAAAFTSDVRIGYQDNGFYSTNFTRKTTYPDTEKVSFLFYNRTSKQTTQNIMINVHQDDTITEICDLYFYSEGTGFSIIELSTKDILKEGSVSLNERHIEKYDDLNVFLAETQSNKKLGYYIWDDINNKKLFVGYYLEKGENIHIHYELDRGLGFIEKLPDGFSKRLTYQVAYNLDSPDSKVTLELNTPEDYYINPNVSLKGYLISDLSASDSNRAVWLFEGKKPLGDLIIVEYSSYEKKTGDNILIINVLVGLILVIGSIFRIVIKVKFKKLLEKDIVKRFCNLFRYNPLAGILYVIALLRGVYISSTNILLMLKYSYIWIYIPLVIGIFAIEYYTPST
ncbi:MAG: hypothetical protein PHD13_00285 [Methanocellales archaeon]|nr:hypothetical protein [Methanocellales archaeon]MDD3291507.1 hypothetical protein [Methanocellales archaeon]MDD5234603.1 hypothetical protein [Methanocellales archaeon]MDD5485044.1 hypothetical protein [Methanocellales archaeon]